MKLDIPPSGLADFIIALAGRHGITYVETPNDALAKVITHLTDDDIEDDPICDLLIALRFCESDAIRIRRSNGSAS